MDVSYAVQSYREYHRLNSKKNTFKNYDFVFCILQTAGPDKRILFVHDGRLAA
jgi:hypothetical protein